MTDVGVWLGIDPGQVRIGVAVSDPDGVLAVPVETVPRRRGDVERVAAIAEERNAVQIIVGLPRSLSGTEGPAAGLAREFAQRLVAATQVPVRLFDERLTTVSAARELRASGKSSRESRDMIDQAAAAVLLQSALDSSRSRGEPAGELVTGDRGVR